MYIKASNVADEGRKLVGFDRKDKKEWNLLIQMAYEARVDASRLLMMMRSHENMEQAETLLEKAVMLAKELVAN